MKKIIKEFFNNFENITKYYNFLVNKTKNHEYVEITNEWLIDNYYLLVEYKNNILKTKKELNKNYKLINDNYLFLKNIVINKNYNIDFKYLVDELKTYQKETNKVFTYKELSLVYRILILIYIERLNELIIEEKQILLNKDKVKSIIKNNTLVKLNDFLDENFDIVKNPNYIFEINNQINKVSDGSTELFKDLYTFLESKNISLKELVNEQYQRKIDNDILISNIFNDLKKIVEYSIEDLYEKVSLCEKLLLTDPVYKKMTIETKCVYRNRIVKLSKKSHMSEYKYLEKNFSNEEHIGYKLFKEKNNVHKIVLSILVILVVSITITYLLSKNFTNNIILSFIMIFIPISLIINNILNNRFKIKFIPRLDYSKGIPEESKTMVIIPTVVSNTNKVKEMFDKLETFYTMNKTDNLYFTLLVDSESSESENEDYDQEVKEFGIEYAKELNDKYNKKLFYFIYRKRVWYESENKFLCYEGKQGALFQFNKVLLGEKINEKKYFNTNTLHGNKLDIKYVITLDDDTKLGLNSALKLVGTISHPLNNPVLNKNNTRVVKGYGIIQPKISIDKETNKSLYDQTYKEICGNYFGEGNYEGRGIYNLEIFDKVQNNIFKEKLITSYDLIEGNCLKCGYVSDIELLYDYSSEFLNDATRQSKLTIGYIQALNMLKKPISLLGKYKILNNIIRMFLNPILLLILFVAFTCSFEKSIFWFLFVISEIIILLILSRKNKKFLLSFYIAFSCIPYYTKLYMVVFFKSLYRLLISHKNLFKGLKEEKKNNSLKDYIIDFWFNILIALIFIGITYLTHNYIALLITVIFISAPVVLYLVSKDINPKKIQLKEINKSNKKLKLDKYKNYNYEKEKIENDIRTYNCISDLGEVSVLSNGKYCLLMDDRGNSFSKYRTIQLNRYREVTDQDYGIFLFIKDVKTNYIWSNTYAPMNTKPDKYEVVFASDKIEYLRQDDKITTKTEIVVCRNHNVEIRKITFKNESSKDKELELTSYTEPIISENIDDVSHKAFNNMFIKTEYDKDTNSLIAKRRGRGDSPINSYMVTRLIIENPLDKYTYETERSNFIGRCNTISTSKELNSELSNYSGENLDPVLSLRNKILVKANSSTSVYLLVGFGRNKEQINDIVKYYDNNYNLEKSYEISTLMNTSDAKNMDITSENMRTYNIMLNQMHQITKLSITEEKKDLLRRNVLSKTGLWKFGVSGDRPIITVEINDISDIDFIKEIVKAFEYYKTKAIYVDIIIINNEKNNYKDVIKEKVDDELYRFYTLNRFYNTPGSVTVIDGNILTREDKSLLNIVPRLNFVIENHISLKEAVEQIQTKNIVSDYPKNELENNIKEKKKEKLVFDNNYGGFKNNGSEYVIYNKLTPTPWSNIIANKKFGTVVTNNGCGYTYAYNSSEFKISSWSNEMITNDKSEGFKFNNEIFDPEKCTHGFGYSILESETKKLNHSITEFVASEDPVKIYLLKLSNKEKKENKINIEYFIKPTFGDFEEKNTRHILSEFMSDDNYLKLRNVYSVNYNDVNAFMTSSEKNINAECNKMLVKSINIDVTLKPNEEKEIVFILGCSLSDEENIELIKKYTNTNNCKKELKNVREKWEHTLNSIQVKTPDNSFDYMINGWYLYQTISSRLEAKAGFYQVSGVSSFKDQLQDAMNICLVKPETTKRQILVSASHQFSEGDVLHWWNEKSHFGLRNRCKDNYLWLVYATIHYLEITEDYDILNEQIPYINGEKLSDYEDEKDIVFNYTNKYDSLLNHCIKSIELSMKSLGPHKIPLIGGGDYIDNMNRVGIKGKGESVWLGFFLYEIIDKFNKIIKKYDKEFDISKYEEFNSKLKDNLNNKTWDGNYYLRAFFDNGDSLASHENTECKIDLLSQSFSILSGVASKDRQERIINSVEEQLVDSNNKIIKLLNPAFSKSLNNPGYIMNYSKGIRENGGQYTQTVSWYIMALIKAGYFDRAYNYYQMINPINRTQNEVDKYKVEPYVIADDIYSNENFAGRGGWTWYTASAGWFYRVGIEEILGIKKQGNKLVIKPNIPIAWNGYKVTYRYNDTIYNIEVIKGNKDSLLVDDNEIISKEITLKNDKKQHKIILNIHK